MTKRKHLALHQGVSETLNGTLKLLGGFSDSFKKLKEELRAVAFAYSVGQNTITNLNITLKNKRDSGEVLQFSAQSIMDLVSLLVISVELAKKTFYWAVHMETPSPFVDMSIGKKEAFTQVFGSPVPDNPWNTVSLNTWFLAEKDSRFVATPVGKKSYHLRDRHSISTALMSTMEALVPDLTPALVADLMARRQTFEAGVQANFLHRLGPLPSPQELSIVMAGSVMKANSGAPLPFRG